MEKIKAIVQKEESKRSIVNPQPTDIFRMNIEMQQKHNDSIDTTNYEEEKDENNLSSLKSHTNTFHTDSYRSHATYD